MPESGRRGHAVAAPSPRSRHRHSAVMRARRCRCAVAAAVHMPLISHRDKIEPKSDQTLSEA